MDPLFGTDDGEGGGQPQLLRQGSRTRLLCGVSQGDKPIEFSWTKDGRPLGALEAVTVRHLDADSSVLTFSNLSAGHLGRYECTATNAAGSARSSAQLFVQGIHPQRSSSSGSGRLLTVMTVKVKQTATSVWSVLTAAH